MTKRDICTSALQEIGVLDPTETAADKDMDKAASAFDDLLDGWNADRRAVYADAFNAYTLTASLTPHTIGPTGTFVVTQRPVSIEAAGLVLTNVTPNVRQPIEIRDAAWWARQPVKALTSTIPTDLYYEPDWTNGKLFFWPVPTTAWQVELRTRLLLSAVAIDADFTMPPGYRRAVLLSVAEFCCRPFAKQATEDLVMDAAKARAVVFSNNREPCPIATRDSGIPQKSSRTNFNYLTRQFGG